MWTRLADSVDIQDAMRACGTQLHERILRTMGACHAYMHATLKDSKGQGTTEYAILVGVLVVIAVLAITLFKPKIQELWNAIATSINGL